MTIIVAKKTKDRIVICSDRQASCGWNKSETENAKIIKVNNYVVASAGAAATATLLYLFCKTHLIKEAYDEDAILTFLGEFHDWLQKKSNDLKTFDNHYMFVVGGKVFVAYGLEVTECFKYAAIGSGRFLALGALSCDASARKAAEVACKYDLGCSGEIDEIVVMMS